MLICSLLSFFVLVNLLWSWHLMLLWPLYNLQREAWGLPSLFNGKWIDKWWSSCTRYESSIIILAYPRGHFFSWHVFPRLSGCLSFFIFVLLIQASYFSKFVFLSMLVVPNFAELYQAEPDLFVIFLCYFLITISGWLLVIVFELLDFSESESFISPCILQVDVTIKMNTKSSLLKQLNKPF